MQITVVNKYHGIPGEYVGRGSPLGNPYRITNAIGREEVITAFREYLYKKLRDQDPAIIAELTRLYNIAQTRPLSLVCFCAPKPCHGDVIREVLLGAHEQAAGG